MRRFLIIYNPTAGKQKLNQLQESVQLLKNQSIDVILYKTRYAGDATQYLQQHKLNNIDVVIAAGGDGTLNEVINGLINKTVPLGLIPVGTTNVLARELGLGKKPEHWVQHLLDNRLRPVYLTQVNDHRFVQMAGIGYDAWVVDNVDLALKKRIGKGAYILSMLKQVSDYGKKTYQLSVNNEQITAYSVVITSGRLYGGEFNISRKADVSNPEFQVLAFTGKSKLSMLWYLLGVAFGFVENIKGVYSCSAKTLFVDGDVENLQADGDIQGQLPARFERETNPVQILGPCPTTD